MTKTLVIDYDERLTDSVKEALKTALTKLVTDGKVKAFEISEIPQDPPKTVLALGVLD